MARETETWKGTEDYKDDETPNLVEQATYQLCNERR